MKHEPIAKLSAVVITIALVTILLSQIKTTKKNSDKGLTGVGWIGNLD